MQIALTCQHSVMSLVWLAVCGQELSTFRAWASHQLVEDQQANRALTKGSHDHILLHGQSVRDDVRLHPQALARLPVRMGGWATKEEESSCKLQASGVEMDDDAVAGQPRIGGMSLKARPRLAVTLQRGALKLPLDETDENNIAMLPDEDQSLARSTTDCAVCIYIRVASQ